MAEAAKCRGPLPAMQANVDAAQARYDAARNRTSGLQAKLDKVLKDLGDEEPSKAISETIVEHILVRGKQVCLFFKLFISFAWPSN